RAFMSTLAIRAPSAAVPAATLSGGNQQKLALARMLATRPRILLLDEPTQGVDVASKAEIHARIRALAAQGTAVLASCSELEEAMALGDHIGVLRKRSLVGILPNQDAT